MIELPEAAVLSHQMAENLTGKRIRDVTVLQSPHKFAWFSGDPKEYPERLRRKKITGADSHGGMVRLRLGATSLVFHEGPNLRYGNDPSKIPKKHQLLLDFADSSFLCVSIQMYGGMACFEKNVWDNKYYRVALEKPSPLSEKFTRNYFETLCDLPDFEKLSAKAFLATEQRVPGLGNGVLQDILFNARIHPKRKMGTVSNKQLEKLFSSARSTLKKMTDRGGRDTEKDLFGVPGGYKTILSRHTVGTLCPRCKTKIQKASFGGGSIYFCAGCQPLD